MVSTAIKNGLNILQCPVRVIFYRLLIYQWLFYLVGLLDPTYMQIAYFIVYSTIVAVLTVGVNFNQS